MKPVFLFALFSIQFFCLSNVLSQDSKKNSNEFSEEISYASNETIKFLRKPFRTSPRLVSQDSKFGITDSNGRILVPLIYDQIDVDFSIREELLMLEIYTSENELFYFYWEEGNESKELYDQLYEEEFKKQNSPLNLETKFRENPFFAAKKENLWGVINTMNEVIIPFEYTSIKEMGQDIFLAKKNDKFSVLTPNNDTIIAFCDTIVNPFIYSGYLPFGSNFAAYGLLIRDNKFGAINLFNQQIIYPKYDSLEYCLWRPEVEWVCAFDPYDICLNCSEGQSKRNHLYNNIVKYKHGNKVGLVDMASMEEIIPATYGFIGITGRTPQIVQLDSMYTILTHKNTRLHIGRYERVSYLNHTNFFKVSIDGKIGVYNHLGEQLIKNEWQDVLSVFYNFSSYRYIVKRKGKFGIIDGNGHFIIRNKYDAISLNYDRETHKQFLTLERKGEVKKVLTENL